MPRLTLREGRAYPSEQGMADMSKKFLDMGAEVYVEADKAAAVKESNKAL